MKIPKLRSHSTGQFRVTIDGKTYYLGAVKIEAEKRYRALLAKHLLPVVSTPATPASSITVGELWREFIADQQAIVSPRWWDKKHDQLRMVALTCFPCRRGGTSLAASLGVIRSCMM